MYICQPTIRIVIPIIEAVRGLPHKKVHEPSLINKDLLKFSSINPPSTKANMSGGIGKSYKRIKVAITAILVTLGLLATIVATYFVDTNFLTLLLSFSPGGIYVMSFNNFDIYLMIGIAVIATFMRLYDFPMPPLILAFVLGGLMEENLRRSLLISNGSWDFLWSRPLTASIIAVTISIVSWQIYKTLKSRQT